MIVVCNIATSINAFSRHSYRMSRSILLLYFIVIFAYSQVTEFIPKSKKEIQKENLTEQKERKRISSSGVLSVTKTKFIYRFGKVDKIGMIESLSRYDNKGNTTKEITYNHRDGKIETTISYTYDKNGNLVEEITKKDEVSTKIIHRYNVSNRKIESVFYKSDGTVERKISYVYDDSGLLLETVGRMDDGKIFMKDTYLYDEDGNIVEFKNNLKKFVMSYDEFGNISSISKFNRYFKTQDSVQFNLNELFTLKYDRSGNLLEMRSLRPDSTLKIKTKYIVNESGQVLEEKEFTVENKLVYSRTLKYNKNQYLIEESGVDRALKFRNVYKYDSRGNKTEWISYDQINEPITLTKYTFGRYAEVNAQGNQVNSKGFDSLLISGSGDPLDKNEFFQILGCRIIAPDGTYLGMVLADTANPQSIVNSWGQYGFNQSPTSIFNSKIPYGGDNGLFSPFNPESPSPPSIYKDGKFFTYFTENENFRPRSSPKLLVQFLKTLVRQN
jgi:YD repeat-containing protein